MLAAEVEALRTQTRDLTTRNAQLEKENRTLVNEVRAERVQGMARTRRARELESALKQRDTFVHAMIDINLHQHVLKNAYFSVRKGCSVDEAIVSAILSAASRPASPWSRILARPDATQSDIYKCAIELAAAARIRADKSLQIARFWRHVAKCGPRNADIITPSPSHLEEMDDDLKKEARANMLDSLLDRLRAGENIRKKKEEERRPMGFSRPDTPVETPNSPASIFFKFYRTQARRTNMDSDLSLATASSWNSDFMAPLTSSKNVDCPSAGDITKSSSNVSPHSLERIREAFSVSSLTDSLDCNTSFGDSFHSTCRSLQPASSLVAGRGRSATVPFSARDLAFLSVKNVISKVPIVTAPGGKEQKAQELAGRRVRFNKETPLIRSKAIKAKRPRIFGSGCPAPSPTKTPLAPSSPIERLLVKSDAVCAPVQAQVGLPTPPADVDSIRYVRPPTVTRRRGSSPLRFGISSIVTLSSLPSRTSLESVPSSPPQQNIRHYVVKDPSPSRSKRGSVTYPPCRPSSGSGIIATPRDPLTPQKQVPRDVGKQPKSTSTPVSEREPDDQFKRRSSIPVTPSRRSSASSYKENAPAKPQTSVPITPVRSAFGSSEFPTRTSSGSTRRRTYRASTRTPPRPSMAKSVIPILKPVQPLRIVKKNPVKKPPIPVVGTVSFASPLGSRRQRNSPASRIPPRLPR